MIEHSLTPEQPVRKSRTLWWLAAVVITAGLLALAVSVAVMSLKNLDQRLTRLEAQENTVATTETLSALQSDISALRDRLDADRKTVAALQQQVSAQASRDEAGALRPSLAALQQTQQAQEKRLEALMAQVSALKAKESLPAAPAAEASLPPQATKPVAAKSRTPLKPPFVLTGVEKRGTEVFAAVAPRGYSSLTQVALIGEGETVSGWTLIHAGAGNNEATFRVSGRPAVLKVTE